jgi:hypothetical protein
VARAEEPTVADSEDGKEVCVLVEEGVDLERVFGIGLQAPCPAVAVDTSPCAIGGGEENRVQTRDGERQSREREADVEKGDLCSGRHSVLFAEHGGAGSPSQSPTGVSAVASLVVDRVCERDVLDDLPAKRLVSPGPGGGMGAVGLRIVSKEARQVVDTSVGHSTDLTCTREPASW